MKAKFLFLSTVRRPLRSPLFPYTTLFRSIPSLAFSAPVPVSVPPLHVNSPDALIASEPFKVTVAEDALLPVTASPLLQSATPHETRRAPTLSTLAVPFQLAGADWASVVPV